MIFFFQAEDGIRDAHEGLEFRRVLFRSRHFWIPEGFAHGFAVRSEKETFTYLCTETYGREADAGIRWNDPALAIDWPVAEPLLSDKDMRAPLLADVAADRLPVYPPCGSCCSAPPGR